MSEQLTSPLDQFKPREIEILGLMADGLSNKEIGDTLFITRETVRWYIKHIYSKLGTSRRVEAITLARKFKLLDDEETAEAATPTTRSQLPLTTGPFIGRDDTLTELQELLAQPNIRLLSIIATGGMGKSRLSLEFGHLQKASYKHGTAFIDLTTISHPDDIPQVALNALGQAIHDQNPAEQLIDYCRSKELLLIFDNFEHLLSGASLLTDILQEAPHVTIIATSRERLKLQAETVCYLEPIKQSASQLFHELAAMMHPHLNIDPADQPDIARIVSLVGGLPLAIVLAATWLDTLTPAEIADEIAANLDFLSTEMGDIPERQRSIYALLDPTWAKLKPEEQKAFMWASVFRGGFRRELFQQVTGASIRVVQQLLHRSLIGQGRGRRYDLHPLIRQYAAEKLADHQMVQEAAQAHLATLTTYAEQQIGQMENGHYLDGLQMLVTEQDNLHAALDWSLAGHAVDKGITLAETIQQIWIIRAQLKEAAHYFELALTHRPNLAGVHMRLAFIYHRLGKSELAVYHNRKAIELAEASQNIDILAKCTRYSTFIEEDSKSPQERQAILEEALSYAELAQNARATANCNNALGMLAFDSGTVTDNDLAHFQKALNYYEAAGDLLGTSVVLYNMSVAYHLQGDRRQARILCERSLKLKQEIGDQAGAARRLSVLATWDIDEEEFEQASRYLSDAHTIAEELGERRRLQPIVLQEGLLALILGNYKQAEANLIQALKLANETNMVSAIAISHAYTGLFYLLIGRVNQAEPHVMQAIRTHQPADRTFWTSALAYANLLWVQDNVASCIPIAAVMKRALDNGHQEDAIGNKYFLRPLIYRIQQKLGREAWQQAFAQAEKLTLTRLFNEIAAL